MILYRIFIIFIIHIILVIELLAKIYNYNFYGFEYVAQKLGLTTSALIVLQNVKQVIHEFPPQLQQPEPAPSPVKLMCQHFAVAIFQNYKWVTLGFSLLTFMYCTYYQLTDRRRAKRLKHERILRLRALRNPIPKRRPGAKHRDDQVFHYIMNITHALVRNARFRHPRLSVPLHELLVEEQQHVNIEPQRVHLQRVIPPDGPVQLRLEQIQRLLNPAVPAVPAVNAGHGDGPA